MTRSVLYGSCVLALFVAPLVSCAAITGLGQDYTYGDAGAADGATGDASDGGVKADALEAAPPADAGCFAAKIIHPGTDPRAVDTDVPFTGTARDAACLPILGSKLRWDDDLEGRIGQGETFTYRFTMVGTHVVTLTAVDAMGRTATDSVTFKIF